MSILMRWRKSVAAIEGQKSEDGIEEYGGNYYEDKDDCTDI